MHTLIPVKPVASAFTLHQSSTDLEVTYCAHCLQDLFSTGYLTKVLASVVWFSLLQRKTWWVRVRYMDPWPVLKKIKELVLTYNHSSPKQSKSWSNQRVYLEPPVLSWFFHWNVLVLRNFSKPKNHRLLYSETVQKPWTGGSKKISKTWPTHVHTNHLLT